MLLRLRVNGFKNLDDLDVRFGPLTCFIGPNGVGKSNILDAIQFLRHLAQDDIHTAAEAVRPPARGGFSPLELFRNLDPSREIQLSVDLLVPQHAVDDFGQAVRASVTLLRYSVSFGFSQAEKRLELRSEDLVNLKKGEAKDVIGFPHKPPFRQSVVHGKRFGAAFISTTPENGAPRDSARAVSDDDDKNPMVPAERVIELHGDGGSRGRPVAPGPSPRTILGGTGTRQYPTVVAARREMSSWHSLHLEPSSLRTPDRLGERSSVDEHGRFVAATLHRLARDKGDPTRVYAEAANLLAQLVPGVREIRVREDATREQYVVEVKTRESSVWFPPRALSDGLLRYLALVLMQMDSRASRVLCVEEPENGIHPGQVPGLVRLLHDYAVDPTEAVDEVDNPLRQVILSSHSPDVVRQLRPDEVLFVETVLGPDGFRARIRPVDGDANWRESEGAVPPQQLEKWMGGAPPYQRAFDFKSAT